MSEPEHKRLRSDLTMGQQCQLAAQWIASKVEPGDIDGVNAACDELALLGPFAPIVALEVSTLLTPEQMGFLARAHLVTVVRSTRTSAAAYGQLARLATRQQKSGQV